MIMIPPLPAQLRFDLEATSKKRQGFLRAISQSQKA